MNLWSAANPQPFEVTYDQSGLIVNMSVYDITTGSAVLVSGPTAMTNLGSSGTYFGFFTPTIGHAYLVVKTPTNPIYDSSSETGFAYDTSGTAAGSQNNSDIVEIQISDNQTQIQVSDNLVESNTISDSQIGIQVSDNLIEE